MSNPADFRTLMAGAHKNMADLVGKTADVYAQGASTALYTGLSAIVRDFTQREIEILAMKGIEADTRFEFPRQTNLSFTGDTLAPKRHQIVYGGARFEVREVSHDDAETTSSGLSSASVYVISAMRLPAPVARFAEE